MIYYIADTHFNHENIMRYCHRPFNTVEEMNETMIERWNKTVKPEDTVYILGDFCFGNLSYARQLLQKLNGHKHLIKGNHDRWLNRIDAAPELESVSVMKTINDGGHNVVLCHYPLESWDRKFHGSYHIYGHVHNSEEVADIENRFNAGVDVTGFTPVSLYELIMRHQYKLS